jgi:hypothetical protein
VLGSTPLECTSARGQTTDVDEQSRVIRTRESIEDLCPEGVNVDAAKCLLHCWKVVCVGMQDDDRSIGFDPKSLYLTWISAEAVHHDDTMQPIDDPRSITAYENGRVHDGTLLLTTLRVKSDS